MERRTSAADIAVSTFAMIFKIIKTVFMAFAWILITLCLLTKNR